MSIGIGVAEVAVFQHACEGEAVTKLTHEKIPYFNAPIYLENKTQIGKVEEIFGPINEAVSAMVCFFFFLGHFS
jgi:H/ACA ribonucleoprotein complex subunit 1